MTSPLKIRPFEPADWPGVWRLLEPVFRAVAVMACDEDVIPSPSRIEAITDDCDLDEVYAAERHLLYVACTRARDHLQISSGGVGSKFLDDMA
ncbi:ATP-dependent helicase [Synechococcus sp. 1G10]|uniref:ATP-dependent helicase n=1 Tax=Synechococcus sp. 1G10 TaxID=2025605 RepID=UPI0018E93C75|nr:ATP-dependent helicase [Synechococcus sp. 1G10]